MMSPGSGPGSPAYPQPTPMPGSSATRTNSAGPPRGAGPAVSTTIARAPGSPPQASPVTDQPAGMGAGTQAGTRASAVTAATASGATGTGGGRGGAEVGRAHVCTTGPPISRLPSS